MLHPYTRQAPLKVELHVKMVLDPFNSMQAVLYSVDFTMEKFNNSMRITKLLGNSEYLCILE